MSKAKLILLATVGIIILCVAAVILLNANAKPSCQILPSSGAEAEAYQGFLSSLATSEQVDVNFGVTGVQTEFLSKATSGPVECPVSLEGFSKTSFTTASGKSYNLAYKKIDTYKAELGVKVGDKEYYK